jgi:hypothetical protein
MGGNEYDWPSVDGDAVDRASLAVSIVALLLFCSAIMTHRNPAGIDDRPSFFDLVAGYRSQYAERYVFRGTEAQIAHDQVKEHIDTGAKFRDAFATNG